MIFGWIEERRTEYPVVVLCRVTGVSRSGYYAWAKRRPSGTAIRRDELVAQIREVHSEMKGRYGSPRLTVELSERGIVCNTLNLEFGSQQADHTDSLYMAAPDGEHLIASWIALEDGHLDAGPLRYWPGSHRIAPYRNKGGGLQHRDDEVHVYRAYMAAEVARRGLKVERLVPRAGDLFIWHGQLFHGGEAIADPSRTRRSLVTHYWRARDVEGIHAEIGKGRYWHARKAHQVG